MSEISVRGYCNNPKTKEINGKRVTEFSLSETYKDKKTGGKTYGFYNCTLWEKDPPPDGSYVSLKGFLKLRSFEKDGHKRTSVDVNVQELEVSPLREAHEVPKESWEN